MAEENYEGFKKAIGYTDPGGAFIQRNYLANPPPGATPALDPTSVAIDPRMNRAVSALSQESNIAKPSKGFDFFDPGFLNMLAGIGASLDPEGPGGAIGKATQGYIQSKQYGKASAAKSQEHTAKQKEYDAWVDEKKRALGAMGSPDQAGPSQVKVNKNGSVTYTIDPPNHLRPQIPTNTGQVGSGQTSQPSVSETVSAPLPGYSTRNSQPTGNIETPFLKALG